MRIDVTELEVGQPVHRAFHETVDSRSDDVRFDVPVTGTVTVERTAATVHVAGRLTTTAPLTCGRCLVPYRQDLAVTVHEEFAIAGGGRDVHGALGAEDFVLPLGPEPVLDVAEVVRQHLLLALPMVPVCRADCRGLCPQCGANRNDVDCGHRASEGDPRLAPLLQWNIENATLRPSTRGARSGHSTRRGRRP